MKEHALEQRDCARFWLWLVMICTAWLHGCGLASSPEGVFDSYIEAYTAGDVEQLWMLSSPKAQQDSDRVRAELLAGLRHEEMPLRIHFEGTFGVTAEDIEPMTRQQFFYWAVATVRRRLGVGFIRSTMRRVSRIRVETIDARHKVVVYRQGEALARLVLAAVENNVRKRFSMPVQPAQRNGAARPPDLTIPLIVRRSLTRCSISCHRTMAQHLAH